MAKGIIFDIDGVLLDSIPVWEHVAVDFLTRLEKTPLTEMEAALRTMSLDESAEYLIKTYCLNMTSGEVLKSLEEIMAEAYTHSIPLKPGVLEFLQWMKAQQIPAVIATSSIRTLAETALKRLGIMEYFTGIVTDADAGRGKRFPDIYLMAADRIGLPPNEIWVLEDSFHAMETAKAAGFLVAAVRDEGSLSELSAIRQCSDRYLMILTDLMDSF